MKLVLDTSAAVEVVLRREYAGRILDRLLIADQVISSDFFRAEVANVIAKYVKSGMLTKENALSALTFIYDIVDEYIPISENDVEAFHESIRLEHPAYDMLYFTLARRNSATLVTCDKKLCALSKKEGISAITGQIPI